MEIVSSAEFQRNPGRYQDMALSEPLLVTNKRRERLVLLSVQEYRRLQRVDRQSLAASELSDRDLLSIASAEVSAEGL
mgnify:CR=1 FL=1